MRCKPSFTVRAWACLALGGMGLQAWAGEPFEQAGQRGKLLVGVRYVAPSYAAGAKFRTPESLAQPLAADLAARMHVPLAAVRIDPAASLRGQIGEKFDAALIAVSANGAAADAATGNAAVVPTAYAFAPMAIMRTDTGIRSWQQLKGRKVCVAEGGFFAGMAAARYGARELSFKSPADSLLALRAGGCDAALHDSAMLEELIKLPEWKKFSARLESDQRFLLAFAVPNADRAAKEFLQNAADHWKKTAYIGKLQKEAVRNIAFEVYLEQNVPDCH